jgi:site-specific DNA recombinase
MPRKPAVCTVCDLYLRKSSEDRGRSVARQETDLKDDLAEEGLQVGLVFADSNLSASVFARKARPNFAALVEHIRAGNCQMVAMWESSRGSRTATEWFEFLELLKTKGVLLRIQSHRRTYDPRNPRDWKSLAEDGIDAHHESLKLAGRVRDGKQDAARRGTPPGALLYGYKRIYDPKDGSFKEQVEHLDNAKIAKEIIRRVADGDGIHTIMRDLNNRGVPGPRGRRWETYVIRQMVRNIGYIGRRVHRGEDFGPACWAPLVDEVTWRRANARLDDPERRTSRGTELQYLLANVPHCGQPDCPGRLVSRGRDRYNARRYACRLCSKSSIISEPLEQFIEFVVLRRWRQPDAVAALTVAGGSTVELDAARAKEKELRDRLDEFRASAASGETTPATLAFMEADLTPKIEDAKQLVKRLSAPSRLAHLAGVNVPAIWPGLAMSARREIVAETVHIVVSPARRGFNGFDRWRLASSRWRNEDRTWGEIWAAEDSPIG